jgi:NurA-like 5'-3' nuclease
MLVFIFGLRYNVSMSLTSEDLLQIRTIVSEVVEPLIEPLRGEIEALSNDVKEIYSMISEMKSTAITDRTFQKRSIEEKLLTLNAELLAAAKEAGVTLPRP